MKIKNNLTVTTGEKESDKGAKRGRVVMFKGSMDKDNRVRGGLNMGGGVGKVRESNGGKMVTTVIAQQ